MGIVCTCSSCGKCYAFEEKLAGKRVKCKNCAAVMAMPGGAGSTAAGHEA